MTEEKSINEEYKGEIHPEDNELINKAMDEKTQQDFYQKLRNKIKKYINTHPGSKYINYLIAAPDLFHLLCKLIADSRVPFSKKATIAGAILYFVSPIDIITDIIPGAGIVDDVVIAVNVINGLVKSVDESVIEEHWAGDNDIWKLIKQLLDFADSVIGAKMLDKIKNFLNSKNNK